MAPQTFIFIGRSGCGKGTQVELLKKVLKEKDPTGEILHLETGVKFREFISGSSYSSKLAHDIATTGSRQPDFLAIRFWSDFLVDSFDGVEHVICDGICRSLPEASVFTSAMDFYSRSVSVVYLNVSREWSEERLMARGREDDKNEEEVKKRLDWFDKDTLPAIKYFTLNPAYTVLDINGEQSIEDVHKEIVQKLGW